MAVLRFRRSQLGDKSPGEAGISYEVSGFQCFSGCFSELLRFGFPGFTAFSHVETGMMARIVRALVYSCLRRSKLLLISTTVKIR